MRKQGIRFFYWLQVRFKDLQGWYKKHEETIKKCAQSKMTPFILFGLIIVFAPISILLMLLALFLFWVSLVYHLLSISDSLLVGREW